MKRRNELWTGLRFAALAGLSAVAALVALEPCVGAWRARALVALALLPLAGVRCADSSGARALAAVGLSLASLALGFARVPWPALAVPLAGAYGVARALCAGRSSGARELALGAGLVAGGLALGAFCEGRSALSFGLAIWAFLLVQAAYGLFESPTSARSAESGDPFERARDQALALLEEEPR